MHLTEGPIGIMGSDTCQDHQDDPLGSSPDVDCATLNIVVVFMQHGVFC